MAPKLTPKERELACSVAMDTAAELINAVCGSEGSRIVKINSDAASISFAVPPDVIDQVDGNPGLTVENLLAIPWSREWSLGILRLTHPEWEAYPPHKREELQRGLLRHLLEKMKT